MKSQFCPILLNFVQFCEKVEKNEKMKKYKHKPGPRSVHTSRPSMCLWPCGSEICMRWIHAWLKVSILIFRLRSYQLSPAFAFCLGCVMPGLTRAMKRQRLQQQQQMMLLRICLKWEFVWTTLLRCQHQLAVHLNWQFICVSLDRELANKFSLYACVQPALWFGVPVHFDHGQV